MADHRYLYSLSSVRLFCTALLFILFTWNLSFIQHSATQFTPGTILRRSNLSYIAEWNQLYCSTVPLHCERTAWKTTLFLSCPVYHWAWCLPKARSEYSNDCTAPSDGKSKIRIFFRFEDETDLIKHAQIKFLFRSQSTWEKAPKVAGMLFQNNM